MKLTNFDWYLRKQLADPVFVRRFKRARKAWKIMLLSATRR